MTSDTTPALDGPTTPAPADAAPSPRTDAAPTEVAAAVPAEPATRAPDPATEPPRVAMPRPSHRTRLAVNVVLAAALAILFGGIAFAAGRATAPGTGASANDSGTGLLPGGFQPDGADGQLPGGPGGNGAGQLGPEAGGMSIRGTVQALDADSITIELATGTTVTIAIDQATDYHRQADASASDVSTGTTVIVELDGLGLRIGTGATAADITIVP